MACVLVLAFTIAFSILPLSITFGGVGRGELLLRFKPGASWHSEEKVLKDFGLEVLEEIPQIKVLVVSVPENALQRVKSALMRNPMVDFVEENAWVSPQVVPNDYYFSFQWHLSKIGAPDAWGISVGSSNVTVAVLDSGVDPSHPDLAGKLLSGWNFYNGNGDTSDVTGHGTAVAGVAAAATNNTVGVAGVGWKCLILPVRVTDENGYASYSLLSKGLVYAADRGARVAVVSFQIFNGSALTSAAKYFMDKGGLVFAAGGNTGQFENYTDNPYIISVSGTTSDDKSWGSYGPYIDLSAPCSAIYTTIKGGGYGDVGGTSFSAPIAAGVAALIFSVNPSLTPSQVEQILEATAVDLGDPGYDIYYGWGRVDAYAALKMASGVSPPPPDTNPPSVKITCPSDGDTVSGAITVKVDASDDSGVSKVELYKNGVLFAVDSEAPYEFYWDTTADPDGVYVLAAKAYDVAGNCGESSSVSVNVVNAKVLDNNPPSVSIVQPLNGSTVSKTIDVVASASDESGISKVEFYIDGKLAATVSGEPYVYRWNTRSVKNGWHTLTVKAYDKNGNTADASIKVYGSNRK
jgi:subtilisin family serine protease